MFSNSRNILISGGSFNHVEGGGQTAFEKLHATIANGAMHNSSERFDPPKCYPGTRIAVIKQLHDWIVNNHSTFMHWLYGPAGAGKSAIMQEIAELCFEKGSLIASFFFSRTSLMRKDETRLVSTIAYQLAQSIPQTRHYIEQLVEDDPAFLSKDLQTQLQLLVIEPLNQAFPSYHATSGKPHLILIDGLDECNNPAAQQRILTSLLTVSAKCRFRIIFLIASRPETHLKIVLNSDLFRQGLSRTALDDEYQAAKDIQLFLQGTFTNIRVTHPLREYLPPDWPGPGMLDALVRKSSGQFIYAATVARYISPPGTRPDDRLDVVLGLSPRDSTHEFPFAELDALYSHILSSLKTRMPALRVLALVAFPIHSTSHQWSPKMVDNFLDLRPGATEEALNKLASVVALKGDPIPQNAHIQILHASLVDFLLDEQRSGNFYIHLPGEGARFARMCLKQLTSGTDSQVFDNVVNCFEGYCRHAAPNEALCADLANLSIPAIAQNRLSHKSSEFRTGKSLALIVYRYLQSPKLIELPETDRKTLVEKCKEAVDKFIEPQVHLYRRTSPLLRVCLTLYAADPALMLNSTRYKYDTQRPCSWADIVLAPAQDQEFSSSISVDDSSMCLRDIQASAGYLPLQGDHQYRKVFLPFIGKFLNPDDFAMATTYMTLYIGGCESTWTSITPEDRRRASIAGWKVDPVEAGFDNVRRESFDNTLLSMKHEAYQNALRYLPLLLPKASINVKLNDLLSRTATTAPGIGPDIPSSQEAATVTWEHGYSGIASGQGPSEELLELRSRALEAINKFLSSQVGFHAPLRNS